MSLIIEVSTTFLSYGVGNLFTYENSLNTANSIHIFDSSKVNEKQIL